MKHKVPKIIFGVLLLLLAGCIVKIAVWEHFYYNNKEGVVRAVAPSPEPEDEIVYDETEPTPQSIAEWTVSADKPRYLSVPKLNISNAKVREIGIKSNKQLDTPNNIFDVGWYRKSGKPGTGGTLLLDGHNGGPTRDGVFKRLGELKIGDVVIIERGDGELFTYEVAETEIVPLSEADAYMSKMQTSPIPGRESISIITCTGGWIAATRNYDHRVMLRAVLVED